MLHFVLFQNRLPTFIQWLFQNRLNFSLRCMNTLKPDTNLRNKTWKSGACMGSVTSSTPEADTETPWVCRIELNSGTVFPPHTNSQLGWFKRHKKARQSRQHGVRPTLERGYSERNMNRMERNQTPKNTNNYTITSKRINKVFPPHWEEWLHHKMNKLHLMNYIFIPELSQSYLRTISQVLHTPT